MATTLPASRPFDALDRDWARLCRHHRRQATTDDWATKQPDLAGITRLEDLILPPGADRTIVFGAVARLAADGDDLAARALLQLLIPGLVGLANRWRHRFDSIGAAGWEVIARATELINRLRLHTIQCRPAGYIIRSIERDLAIQVRREERISSLLADTDERQLRAVERTGQVASAEAAAFAGPLQRHMLARAAATGDVSHAAVTILWLHAAQGRSIPEAARSTGVSVATAYRLRTSARQRLEAHLRAAS